MLFLHAELARFPTIQPKRIMKPASAEDAELAVFIMERAWSGREPPQVGQAIEGTLCLQGRPLWAS